MTPAQKVALEFMNHQMDVDVHLMGRVVYDTIRKGGNYQGIGSATLMHLRRKGYAVCLGGGRWQITNQGREALTVSEGGAS